jgi:hypothetical protein
MTTITTAELRRSTPRRTRRYFIAALATAALLAPAAFVVSRINDNDSHKDAALKTNPILASPAVSPPAVNATFATASLRFTVNESLYEACKSGYAEACRSAHTWAPVGLESLDVLTDACNGGYAEACVMAAKIGVPSRS